MVSLALKYNYRLYLLIDLTKLFGPLTVVTYVVISLIIPHSICVGYLTRSLWTILISIAYWSIETQYTHYMNVREAKKRGAVLVPKLKGKWPGNLDIISASMKKHEEGYALENMEQFFGDNDTFNLGAMWTDTYFTRNHHIMQAILATHFNSFHKGPELNMMLRGVFGDGILATDGAEAKAHRALVRPFFTKDRIRDFEILERYVDKTVTLMRNRALSAQSVDVQDLFQRFTLDAAGEFLFGTKDFNALDSPLPLPGRIHEATFLRSLRGRFWAIQELWKDKTQEDNKIIDRFVHPLIANALKNKKVRGDRKCAIGDGSLVDHLADATNDVKLIRNELFNILSASRDSTSILLTFVIYLLSLHPDVTAKLHNEVMAHLPCGSPTFEDIRKMNYLRAVLNETLRLFPPIPINCRTSKSACLIPGDRQTNGKPFYIPSGNKLIFYLPIALQRRKDLWGDDADDFDPERWIDERVQKWTENPFVFIPFNAGPRVCLGQEFAYNEASFMLIRILQIFDTFTLRQQEDAPPGSCPPPSWKGCLGRKGLEQIFPKASLTLYVKGGCWIQMGLAQN
ncbi:cytochrome P450 [Cantharellus anzutake]|uniref:cytochrome P450 n=1 Tax=Cantharellus anzutake TaxID=1750568 RepID=UPI0019071049|nr:cytochrome P450 [Cantharellus anzutake]KAF8331890.1 cytochrome P450 [Cantharellus anzutake]